MAALFGPSTLSGRQICRHATPVIKRDESRKKTEKKQSSDSIILTNSNQNYES